MIGQTESGLGSTPYTNMGDPLKHKTSSVKVSPYEPEFGQITHTGAWDGTSNLDVIVYNNRIYRVNGTNLEWTTGSGWTVDTASFTPATLISGARVTLSTDGTGLYAVAPTTTGIQQRYKLTAGGAWTAWAVSTVAGFANTQSRANDAPVTLSALSCNVSPEVGYPLSAMLDSSLATHYSGLYNGTTRHVFTFTTTGAFTAKAFTMQSADWTNLNTNADKRAAPAQMKLEFSPTGAAPWTMVALTDANMPLTSWPPAQVKTWYLNSAIGSGTTTWRLTINKPLKPKGGRIQIGAIQMIGSATLTVPTWEKVVSPPDTPGIAFAVRYDAVKNAYHVCRLDRSATGFATFGYATNCGDLTFQYRPNEIDTAKMSPDENGATVYGILLTTPYPGERREKYENNQLTYENMKDHALLFFTNYHTYVITSMDSFSDPVVVDLFPQSSVGGGTFRALSSAYSARLSVLNNRWTIINQDYQNVLTDVIGTGDAYSFLGQIYQSVNGEDWSIGKRIYAQSSNSAKGQNYELGELILYNSTLYWVTQYAITSGYNPPIFGATPTLTDLTTRMITLNINASQVLSASIVFNNSDGYFDAASPAIDKPWLVYIYARLADTGDEMIISRGTAVQSSLSDSWDADGRVSRTLLVDYQDFMGRLNGEIQSEEWINVDPVAFFSEYSRQSAIQVVSGAWAWMNKMVSSRPTVTLQGTTVNGVALYAPSVGCINGRFRVNPQVADATGEAWIVRWVDTKNFITVRFFVTGGVEKIEINHYVQSSIGNSIYESTTTNITGFTGTNTIDIITRYGKIYVVCQKQSTNQVQVISHTINNLPALLFTTIDYDTVYKGAFGYLCLKTSQNYKRDEFVNFSRWMTIEKTVRHFAAKAFIFSTSSRNRLPPTTGQWTAEGTTTFSIVANATDLLKRIDSVDILASTAPDINYRYLPMTGTDRLISFSLGANMYPFEISVYAEVTDRIYVNYLSASNLLIIDANSGFGGSTGFAKVVMPLNILSGGTPFIEIAITNRDENTFDGIEHVNLAVYVNGRLSATCCFTHVTTFIGGGSVLYSLGKSFNPLNNQIRISSSSNATVRLVNLRIASLSQASDPLTLDPGETPMQALNRVTEGLNLRLQMRHNGMLYARPAVDFETATDPIAVAKSFVVTDFIEGIQTNYSVSLVKNHIRVQGAYLEGEYADRSSVIKIGHRFQLINNPYIYTVDECKLEAKRLVARSISEAEIISAATHWYPLLEIGDVVSIQDVNLASRNIFLEAQNVSFNFIGSESHKMTGRRKL